MKQHHLRDASLILLATAMAIAVHCVAAEEIEAGEVPSLRLLSHERVPWAPRRPGANPRPGIDAQHVPLRTSFYMLISSTDPHDDVLADSVTIQLQPAGGEPLVILQPNQQFAPGYWGQLIRREDQGNGPPLRVFVDTAQPLQPGTAYTIRVQAQSAAGAELSEDEAVWRFTTEQASATHRIAYQLDLSGEPDVVWHGEFFNGFARPSFATSTAGRAPHYEMMVETRREFPVAWNLHRDAYLTGFEHEANPFKSYPNIVREQETRRITAITRDDDGVRLKVEAFFGHQQYGIESNRPLSADYHEGDEVLIADGRHDARAHVVATDDQSRTVLVTEFADPPQGWQLAYIRPLPVRENPEAPGLFPPGGTYLRKFDPPGTPHYYWGRLNHVWDRLHGKYGFRLIPRFADAPGDLAIDGRSGTTAKDLVQLHEVVRTITSHIIERYGDATLQWPWVVFNEPDLMSVYWRNRDWEELQRFYDYTSDAILRAFEDHGYDSSQVNVGGLELGAIAGLNLRLEEFLTHVSPNATGEGALELNAAYADPRLEGRRSQRVEALCAAHQGRGAPFDFLSIHTYDHSELAAAKLIRAKEIALEIDAEYFKRLPIVNHETVPAWRPISDPGAAEMYLGNGYFSTWCANVVARLLERAAADPRFAYGGESPLMAWPGIVHNFDTLNDVVRQIRLEDRTEVIPNPIHHFVNLLSTMRDDFRLLPLHQVGGHIVGGFASTTNDDLRVLLYSHHIEDPQSRSDVAFDIGLTISGLGGDRFEVTEYRFDRANNSYYELARKLGQRPGSPRQQVYTEQEFQQVAERAVLNPTGRSVHVRDNSGTVKLRLTVAGNGTNMTTIRPCSD